MSMFNLLVVFTAKYLIFIIALHFLLYAVIRLPRAMRKDFLLTVFSALIVGFVLVKLVSLLHYSPRPFVLSNQVPLFPHSPNNGFPSDHTVVGVVMALLLWKYNRGLAYALFCLAILVGLARVQADVHHLQDVMGGLLLAVLTVILADFLVTRLKNLQTSEKQV